MKKICLLFIILLSCKTDTKKTEEVHKPEHIKEESRKLYIDYEVDAFSHLQKENDLIIRNLEEIIDSRDYKKFWDANDTNYFKLPYVELYSFINRGYPTYQPTVIALQKKNNEKYLLKIAMMGAPEGFSSLDAIYNLHVIKNDQGDLVFKNTFNDNIATWQQKQYENITYYFDKNRHVNVTNIKKQHEFENWLVDFFDVEKVNYKFIVCNNQHQLYKLIGYDYIDSMFFNEQNGGVCYAKDKLLLSANNTAYNEHELTHLYIYNKFPYIHDIIEEGFATYFGGSLELDYKEHFKILNDYVLKNDINLIDYLFDEYKRHTIIDFTSSVKYSGGALLCSLIYEKQGKEGLFKLMDSGKSDEELKHTLRELFEMTMEELNTHLKTELNAIVANQKSN
ncbi:hypothetical protein [uncultured Kordia sp.]|uniref:hypothetical protein n=1 Tax=uncultured Kordia sp. TaxID=507699 RepID=UPI002631BD87|nr:hypothetical protein [uncultured Kordia sp.]